MKYTSATNVFLFASIASSLISWGSAVPRPGPAGKVLQTSKTRNDSRASSSSPSTGLLVDREGNLYSPRVSKTNNRRKELVCVRGGALCVDGEGNFYTPKDTSAIVTARNNLRDDTSSSSPLSRTKTSASTYPSRILRGGSNNHNIGGLGVDIEGNLFATQGRASATPSSSAAALLLRGGDLNVDNEGNFYYPRFPALKKPAITSYRRRGAHDTVLLTKKTTTAVSNSNSSGSCSDTVKTKKPSSQDDAMAFIGYNNALMET